MPLHGYGLKDRLRRDGKSCPQLPEVSCAALTPRLDSTQLELTQLDSNQTNNQPAERRSSV